MPNCNISNIEKYVTKIYFGVSWRLKKSIKKLKLISRPPKLKNLEKMKEILPGIRPRNKCAKYQPNPTICEVSRLPQSFRTHTQIHRYTDTNCQILAQLKLTTVPLGFVVQTRLLNLAFKNHYESGTK